MTAPWGIELYHPDVLRPINDIVKVSVSQHDHITVSHWLLRFLFFFFAVWFFVFLVHTGIYFFPNLSQSEISNIISFPGLLIGYRLTLIEPKPFEGWESLNVVGFANLFICGHVYSTNLDDALKLPCNFFPRRRKFLAVSTPGSVKFNEPKTITLHDFFLPIVLVELDYWPAIMVKRGS